ncbi:MAG: hypothetical protein H0V88_11885 [Pyrinomonadaceae bacterium]|nr:hypothetical protein [Pyrinomonadaceae bacterium]
MQQKEFIRARAVMLGKTIDELIQLLASDDLPTRFLAEMCLRDKTST